MALERGSGGGGPNHPFYIQEETSINGGLVQESFSGLITISDRIQEVVAHLIQ